MHYYNQEYVGIARQSRFRVICLCYLYIYIYASKTNKENLYDVEFNNVKTKIYGNIK